MVVRDDLDYVGLAAVFVHSLQGGRAQLSDDLVLIELVGEAFGGDDEAHDVLAVRLLREVQHKFLPIVWRSEADWKHLQLGLSARC